MMLEEFIKQLEMQYYENLKEADTDESTFLPALINKTNENYQLLKWLKELQVHRETWEKVELRLKELSIVSDLEYYVHREDNWFDGIKDAMSVVGKFKPKEADVE